jgi:hypothetical protein
MIHPFHGIVRSDPSSPSRRTVLGRILGALAAMAGFVASAKVASSQPTTLAFGEEGGGGGAPGGPNTPTSLAFGEEGGGGVPATTLAFGEEGGLTTLAFGEEGGGVAPGGPNLPTSLAFGEEGGGVPPGPGAGGPIPIRRKR